MKTKEDKYSLGWEGSKNKDHLITDTPGIGNIEFTVTLSENISEDLEQLHKPIPKVWREIEKAIQEKEPITLEQIYAHLMEIYVNRYKDNPPQVYDPYAPKYNDDNGTAGDPNFGKSTTT